MVKLVTNDYILGVDLSYKCTGLAVAKVTSKKNKNILDKSIEIVDYCSIPTDSMDIGEALIKIEYVLEKMINQYHISYISAEQSFVSSNRVTAMRLAQAHGVLMLTAAKHKLSVTYYSVMTLKSKTLGKMTTKKEDGTKKTGEEMKIEVANKVKEIFSNSNLRREPTLDETDAMSAIITFVLMGGEPVKKAKTKRKKKGK